MRSAVLLLTGAVVVVCPWFVRNFVVTGDPTFAFTNSRNLLAHTSTYSGIDRHLDGPVSVAEVLMKHHNEVLHKVVHHLWPNIIDPRFWTEALGMYALALPLAFVGILIGWKRTGEERSYDFFERSVVLLLLSNFVIVCLIYHRQRYYDPFIPLMTIILVQRVFWTFGRWVPEGSSRPFKVVLALCIVVAGGRLMVTLDGHRKEPGISASDHNTYEMLKTLMKDDDVVLSDLSAQTALYGGWRSIRFPANPEDILEIDRRYIEIDSVLISPRGLRHGYRRWLESEEFLTRFEKVAVLANQSVLFRSLRAE